MDSKITKSLKVLVVQRWLPLRQLSAILGYRHGTGIYGRQRSLNLDHHIPTIRVGGTLRVHYDDVILALNMPLQKDLKEPYDMILAYIRQLERAHTQKESPNE